MTDNERAVIEAAKAERTTFIRIGEFTIPVVVDNTLTGNEFAIKPKLTQSDVDKWIRENPEKARKLLLDARREAKRIINQRYSSSSVIKDIKHP